MAYALQENLIAVWAASTTDRVETNELQQLADGLPLHIAAIDLLLKVTVTADAANDDPGQELWNVLQRLTITDIKSNEIVDLRGRQIPRMQHLVTGWRYANVAAIAAGSGAGNIRYLRACIPFHGGVGGVAGFKEFSDAIQPVDRIRGKTIGVQWAAANVMGANQGVFTAAELKISFRLVPMPEVIQGADIRYLFEDHNDAQRLQISAPDAHVFALAIANEDWAHDDYTELTIREHGLLSLVAPWQTLDGFNATLAVDQDNHLVNTSGDFLPLVWQQRQSALKAVKFNGQIVIVTTNTNGADQELLIAAVYDTKKLAATLKGTSATAYEHVNQFKAMAAKKNQGSMSRGKRQMADRLFGLKLMR